MDFSPDLRNITSNVTKQILSKMNLTSFDLNSTQFQEFLADENAVLMLSIALHIVGVCADLVLIYLGFFKRKYRTSSNVLLANWALANLIHSIIMPIVALQRYRAETEFGHPTLILNLVSLFIFIWGLDVVETFADNIKILPLITDWLNTISPVFVVAVLFGFENEFKEYGGKLVKRLRGRHQNKKPDIELVNVAKEVSVLHTSKVEEV